MFSTEERSIYGKNQILETVCQFRFPTILAIEQTPVEFQEAVRDVFPRYECRKEQPAPKVQMLPGQPPRVEQQTPVSNHTFSTVDGAWRINLTKDFIAVTTRRYTAWEEFARMTDKALYQFIQIYKPHQYDRVGLRYINAISRKSLELEQTPWRDLIAQPYLGFLDEEDAHESAFARATQDVELNLRGNCHLKLHMGPGMVRTQNQAQNNEARYMLDIDVSMNGNLPINMAAGALSTLHVHAYSTFRAAITDMLHNAMEPKEEI